ncbi:serine hydrolase [Streptomyces sp. NRRL S-241]|uniref:serine hydrolase n=1 Tax=Streptomyces sp. NRRL S-241 TaxID=1463896 RepID=UPI001F248DDC|nr:serine hydrolase [Streptomyces sp. NRRL S-241]
MKAVTVAGGSSDDPEIESETTVQKTEPEPTTPTDAGARGTKAEPARGTVTEPDVEAEDAPAEPKAQAENPAGDADTRGPKAGRREAETDAGSEAQADPRSGGEPERSGEAELEDEAGTEATGDPRTPTGPNAQSENRPEAAGTRAPKAEPGTGAEPKAPGAPRPEDAARSNAQAEDAAVAVEAQAEARSGAAGTRGPKAGRPEAETDAGAQGDPRTPAGPDAESENRSGDAGTRAPKAEQGTATEAKAPAAPRPEDAARADAQAENAPAEPKAQAEARAAGTSGPRAGRPGAGTGADAPNSHSGAEAHADPRTPARPKAQTENRSDAGMRGPKAEQGTGTEPRAQGAPRPEDSARSGAQSEDAPAGSKAQGENPSGGSDLRGPKAGRPSVGAGADAPKRHTGAEAQGEPRSGGTAERSGEAELADEADSDTKPATNAAPKAGQAEAEAGADAPKAQADSRTPAGPNARAEDRTGVTDPRGPHDGQAEVEAGAGAPKSRTGAEAQAGPRTPAGPNARAENRSGVADPSGPKAGRAEAEAGADAPKAHAKPEAQADPGTPAGSKARAEERTGVADPRGPKDGRAEAKTGADAPKAGAEARSGGEVESEGAARSDAEPKAHGEGRAGADETQVIARPGARPRTGPSWARDVEPDAERTSQFVALKDLDTPAPAPAPVAPRPAPPAAPAAPQPPLELLADLTNTPPPAETPRRTALRRVKIWTPILLLLVGAGAGAQLLRPLPAAQLVAAKSDHTVDGKFSIPWPAKGQGAVRVSGSGDLGTFGEQKPVPTASVAKVMTAYVILRDHPLRKSEPGPDITIDAKTVADGNSEHESRISGLTAGTKFSQQDMLKMLMIPSGNNVARLLARWDSGTDSEAAFVAKMNAAAKELGMTSTTYSDPSGLDAGTVSTAADQLKLAEAVMKDETFRSIVALPNATIKGLSQRLENNNILLNTQGLSIRGIKTGSSTPAGGTLMWAAYKSIGDETPLILGTLMDQRAEGPDEDGGSSLKLVLANSKTIIEAVRTALASVPVIRKGDVVGHVDDGLGGRTPLVAAKDLNVIGVPGQQVKLSLGPAAGGGPLPHTAKDGAEVGVLTVGSGEGAKSVPVAVKGALVEPSFGTRLTRGR